MQENIFTQKKTNAVIKKEFPYRQVIQSFSGGFESEGW